MYFWEVYHTLSCWSKEAPHWPLTVGPVTVSSSLLTDTFDTFVQSKCKNLVTYTRIPADLARGLSFDPAASHAIWAHTWKPWNVKVKLWCHWSMVHVPINHSVVVTLWTSHISWHCVPLYSWVNVNKKKDKIWCMWVVKIYVHRISTIPQLVSEYIVVFVPLVICLTDIRLF